MIKEPAKPSRHFLLLLSFIEMWERFSYYGMRALLVLYLTTQIGIADDEAYSIYALFASIGYLGCVIFGYLADRFFGPRYMLSLGGSIMLVGHALMAGCYFDSKLLYPGLALIAIGTSAFKGNITNILGMCYKALALQEQQQKGYMTFYAIFNFGAFIASIVCGTIGMKYSWHLGFSIAGIGMAIGLLLFLFLQDKILGDVGKITRPRDRLNAEKMLLLLGVMLYSIIIIYALMNANFAIDMVKYLGIVIIGYYFYLIFQTEQKYRINLYILLVLMFFFVVFYALEMQTGGLIILFASRNVDLNFIGYDIAAATVDSINPVVVMLFGLIISRFLNSANNTAFVIRFALGLLCVPLGFLVLYWGSLYHSAYKVDFIYLFLNMAIIAFGELFIGPMIHAKTSELAPKNIRGLVFGMLMFAASYANVVGNFAAKYMSVQHYDGMIDPALSLSIYQNGFLAVIKVTFIAALFFLLVSPIFKRAVVVK
jgi:POT family proton-dependent oligopeptide transporter